MKVKQALIPHFAKFHRQSAALHAEIIRKLLTSKLVPVNAPYFDGARLLIAADCTAYAYAAFQIGRASCRERV